VLRHEPVSSLPVQWVQWADRLRFLPARQAAVAGRDGQGVGLRTMIIPSYTATGSRVEEIRRGSQGRCGIPQAEAERNVQETLAVDDQGLPLDRVVPPYEVVAVLEWLCKVSSLGLSVSSSVYSSIYPSDRNLSVR
jgi:hypothetical protein